MDIHQTNLDGQMLETRFHQDSLGHTHAVVLLCGGAINSANAWRSSARVAKAIELIEKDDESCLLITSGISGHIGFAEEPESHLYRNYLCDMCPGDVSKRVYIEDLSRDTVGNVYFSLKILKLLVLEGSRVIWITNVFHAERLRTIIRCMDQSDYFNHQFELVADLDSELIFQLRAEEFESKGRFLKDFSAAASPEALIFLYHDFYKINRLVEKSKCG